MAPFPSRDRGELLWIKGGSKSSLGLVQRGFVACESGQALAVMENVGPEGVRCWRGPGCVGDLTWTRASGTGALLKIGLDVGYGEGDGGASLVCLPTTTRGSIRAGVACKKEEGFGDRFCS
jgi:hypothetical protein